MGFELLSSAALRSTGALPYDVLVVAEKSPQGCGGEGYVPTRTVRHPTAYRTVRSQAHRRQGCYYGLP